MSIGIKRDITTMTLFDLDPDEYFRRKALDEPVEEWGVSKCWSIK